MQHPKSIVECREVYFPVVHTLVGVLGAIDVEEHRVTKHGELPGALQSHHGP